MCWTTDKQGGRVYKHDGHLFHTNIESWPRSCSLPRRFRNDITKGSHRGTWEHSPAHVGTFQPYKANRITAAAGGARDAELCNALVARPSRRVGKRKHNLKECNLNGTLAGCGMMDRKCS